jgi:hypothetical protein
MSFKSSLIKMAINWTPKTLVLWVGNLVLKGIAELTDFNFDLDTRKAYVQTTLYGETEPIEIWLNNFTVRREEDSYYFILEQGLSNKPWLSNLLAKIAGKDWKMPVPPQFKAHVELLAELLKADETDKALEDS